MRKNIFLLLFLLPGINGFAQQLSVTDDGLDKVVLSVAMEGPAMANLEMKNELKLDAAQYTQVKQINVRRYQKMEALEQQCAENKLLRAQSLRNIIEESDQTLRAVLDEHQMQRYLDLEGRFNMQLMSENGE